MSHKHWFSLLLPVVALLLLDSGIASACSCGPHQTVLDAYEGAGAVIITKVLAVEKVEEKSGGRSGYSGVISTRMVVEKVFKGDLKVGDEITFGQGGGADCIWTFDEENVGQEFLFYLDPREKNMRLVIAFTCGRSSGLKYAGDDLLYLNKLNKVRGKTRISGSIEFEDGEDLSVEGRKIRIIGTNKTYEVKTDENGVYEIYDLPAGKYLLEPETPFGWKLNHFWLGYSPSFAGRKEEEESLKKIPIVLQDKRHAGLDIHFEIDNAIRGKIFDPNGRPMPEVCVKAVSQQKEKESEFHLDCTDEKGRFAIAELPRGSYILVVNEDGRINSSEPFEMFYYPNVIEREKAAVITIGAGEIRDNINIYVPKVEETVTVEGVFLYSDGKPVIDEAVEFEAEKTTSHIEGDARAKTDASGRFSIKILKGLKGKLSGGMYAFKGEFENCPKLEAIIKKTGNTIAEVNTPALSIQADDNLYNLELKYPFPHCKKAKID